MDRCCDPHTTLYLTLDSLSVLFAVVELRRELSPSGELKIRTALPFANLAKVNLHNGGSGLQSEHILLGIDFRRKFRLAVYCIEAALSYEAETNGSLSAGLRNARRKKRREDITCPHSERRHSNFSGSMRVGRVPRLPLAISTCPRDWYFIAEQPAPAPHLAQPEGCAVLRIVLVTVPRVSRSCEQFPDGFDLHLLPPAQPFPT